MRLELRGVGVRFGERTVLHDVDLEALPGELLVLQGPSGSGKSCLLAVAAGLLVPQTGSVQLDGSPLVPADTARLRATGLLLQGLGLLPLLTAAENVEVPLQVGDERLAPAQVVERSTEALGRVGLGDHADRLVEQLSGGQRQRVALARAVVARPALVLADEPTSALDGALRDDVVEVLRQEADRGATVVVATHDAAVLEWADRVVRIADGRLLAQETG